MRIPFTNSMNKEGRVSSFLKRPLNIVILLLLLFILQSCKKYGWRSEYLFENELTDKKVQCSWSGPSYICSDTSYTQKLTSFTVHVDPNTGEKYGLFVKSNTNSSTEIRVDAVNNELIHQDSWSHPVGKYGYSSQYHISLYWPDSIYYSSVYIDWIQGGYEKRYFRNGTLYFRP